MNIIKASVAALGLSVTALPALAQVNANNLISVNLTNVQVLSDIADLLDVNVSDISAITQVQVPIGVAANVCPELDVAAIAQDFQQGGTTTCTASNASRALAQAVQREM